MDLLRRLFVPLLGICVIFAGSNNGIVYENDSLVDRYSSVKLKDGFMIKRLIIWSGVLLLLGFYFPADASAQTEETHAHSMSRKWKGIDVATVLDHSEYDTIGKSIYLYNVGTGRFVIEGGSWAMEGRLFHEDFGRRMRLTSSGKIDSGIEETNISIDKHWYGCNPPTNDNGWNDYKKYCFTTIMDCKPDGNRPRVWTFERVETDTDADTYTYYMTENFKGSSFKKGYYHLGAGWGECHAADYKGDGTFVDFDGDRVCWTTADVKGNTEKKLVNGDSITIDELYQWRVISEEEFINVLNEETVGLNPSVSSLIPDRDFTRNSTDFAYWKTEENTDHTYGNNGRYGYTWGYASGQSVDNPQTGSVWIDQPWDKPLRLKETFDDKNGGSLEYASENSKYGFLSFEGVGKVHTEFEVPYPGWYQIQCYGFCQSNDNDAYLYAQVKGSTVTTSYGGIGTATLERIANGTYKKNNKANCLVVGQELTKKGDAHKTMLWICVTEKEFNAGNKTLVIGFGKDAATQVKGKTINSVDYYFDSDWVCVDDIRAQYMGYAPAFFYEDEETLDYLKYNTNTEENQSQYANAKQFLNVESVNGRYSGGLNLERSMKTNQWNSFSFPIPLTGEQIRAAFGEKSKLAKIHSVGELSGQEDVIDFQTVTLMTTDIVVEPGNFYLLMPTDEPIVGIDPKGNKQAKYYEMGRNFFSVRNPEEDDYEFVKMDAEAWKGDPQAFGGTSNSGNGVACYIQTPGYSEFTLSGGVYSGKTETKGCYAPKGSYVVSNNTIYHLLRDTRIKGFRGWITLDNPLSTTDSSQQTAKMYINGISEGQKTTTQIMETATYVAPITEDSSVYDFCGRKIGTIGMNLPKGIYIIKGKKYLIH